MGGTSLIAAESRLLDSADQAVVPRQGDAAPDFEYTLGDGTTHKLSDLRGKKVVINFWATWCEPCRVEMPDLQKVSQESGDQVAVLGVNWREGADGPKLARATVSKSYAEGDIEVEATTGVVAST